MYHLYLCFVLIAFDKFSRQMYKVMICFQIPSPKVGVQGKTVGDPFLLCGPYTKPLSTHDITC